MHGVTGLQGPRELVWEKGPVPGTLKTSPPLKRVDMLVPSIFWVIPPAQTRMSFVTDSIFPSPVTQLTDYAVDTAQEAPCKPTSCSWCRQIHIYPRHAVHVHAISPGLLQSRDHCLCHRHLLHWGQVRRLRHPCTHTIRASRPRRA